MRVVFEQRSSSAEESLAELSADERERYAQFWRRFKILDNLGWLGLGMFIIIGWINPRRHDGVWWYLFLTGLVIWVVCGAWTRMLVCPRCGVEFGGGLLRLLNPFDLGGGVPQMKCYGCDLSRRELAAISRYR